MAYGGEKSIATPNREHGGLQVIFYPHCCPLMSSLIEFIITILHHYQSTCSIKASEFFFHNNLSWVFSFHVTDLHKSSISSLQFFEVYLLVDYHPGVYSLLLGMSIYCLKGEPRDRPKSIFLVWWRAWCLKPLVLLLTHPFVPWSDQDASFFKQLLGAPPRLWLMSKS